MGEEEKESEGGRMKEGGKEYWMKSRKEKR
jgi:hypothetical protein